MHFFTISFKNAMVYRWSVLFSIAGSILYMAISIMLWRFLYRDTPDMISYMTRYTIISNIIGMFYARGMAGRIGDKVADGSFVTDLIRPISLFFMSWQMELADICANFFLRGLPVILVYSPFLFDGKYAGLSGNLVQGQGYYNIIAVLLAVILGHLLFLLIYGLLGFSAFILLEIWPFARVLDDTIRLLAGGFLPLWILPGFLGAAAQALPFRYLYSFPLELLFGTAHMDRLLENFLILIVWILVFAVLNIIMYRIAIKRAVVQGG